MNRPAITRLIAAVCLFAASGVHAAGEVRQCVGADGHLTLTDQACEGAGLAAVAPGAAAPRVTPSVTPPAKVVFQPVAAPAKALEQRPGTDVATLKAARISLQMADAASSRHARLAALD